MEDTKVRCYSGVASRTGMGVYEADRSDDIAPEGNDAREHGTTDEETLGRFSWAVNPGEFRTAHRPTCPVVTLAVGPKSKRFSVPKDVLVQSHFLARYQEGANEQIKMPEDNPEYMVYLLRFLHTGSFDETNFRVEGPLPDQDMPMCLIRLFCLADKYFVDNLCEEVMELLRRILTEVLPSWNHLRSMKDMGLQNRALWNMFEEAIVGWAAAWPKGGILKQILRDGLHNDGEVAVRLLYKIGDAISTRDAYCEECFLRESQCDCVDASGRPLRKKKPGKATWSRIRKFFNGEH